MVRLHRTSSNHCHEGGGRPAGQVRVSTGWFDHTKPPRTTLLQVKQDYRAVSSQFWVVQPLRTSSNHCDKGVSWWEGQFEVSSGRVNCIEPSRTTFIEPPQTTVMKGEAGRKGSLESVRGGSTALNLLEPL